MKLRLKKHELFIQKCSNLLYKALIRSGSIPFVPKDLPLMEIPTMIIGLRQWKDDSFALVATLNKELSQVYSSFKTDYSENSLFSTFEEALCAFKTR